MLTGTAASQVESQRAYDIAARLVGVPEKVVNSIIVRGRDQVMLKVTVAEVRRDVIKQLGIDLSGSLNYGSAVVNFNNSSPFAVEPGSTFTVKMQAGGFPDLGRQRCLCAYVPFQRRGAG